MYRNVSFLAPEYHDHYCFGTFKTTMPLSSLLSWCWSLFSAELMESLRKESRTLDKMIPKILFLNPRTRQQRCMQEWHRLPTRIDQDLRLGWCCRTRSSFLSYGWKHGWICETLGISGSRYSLRVTQLTCNYRQLNGFGKGHLLHRCQHGHTKSQRQHSKRQHTTRDLAFPGWRQGQYWSTEKSQS